MVASDLLARDKTCARVKAAPPGRQKDETSCCPGRRRTKRIWRQRHQQAAWIDPTRSNSSKLRLRSDIASRLASSTLPSSYSSSWSAKKSEAMYNMGQWSCGYFSVAESGEVLVKPRGGIAQKSYYGITYCDLKYVPTHLVLFRF